jgi:hypothetical protein
MLTASVFLTQAVRALCLEDDGWILMRSRRFDGVVGAGAGGGGGITGALAGNAGGFISLLEGVLILNFARGVVGAHNLGVCREMLRWCRCWSRWTAGVGGGACSCGRGRAVVFDRFRLLKHGVDGMKGFVLLGGVRRFSLLAKFGASSTLGVDRARGVAARGGGGGGGDVGGGRG